MSVYKYNQSIPWHVLKQHIHRELSQLRRGMSTQKGEELYWSQGRAQILEEFLNLPETLTALDQQDVEAPRPVAQVDEREAS